MTPKVLTYCSTCDMRVYVDFHLFRLRCKLLSNFFAIVRLLIHLLAITSQYRIYHAKFSPCRMHTAVEIARYVSSNTGIGNAQEACLDYIADFW
jgi:hypothetical protein